MNVLPSITPESLVALAAAIRSGMPFLSAAASIGIPPRLAPQLLETDDRIAIAMARAEGELLQEITTQLLAARTRWGSPDPRALKMLLSLHFPARLSGPVKRSVKEKTSPDTAPPRESEEAASPSSVQTAPDTSSLSDSTQTPSPALSRKQAKQQARLAAAAAAFDRVRQTRFMAATQELGVA